MDYSNSRPNSVPNSMDSLNHFYHHSSPQQSSAALLSPQSMSGQPIQTINGQQFVGQSYNPNYMSSGVVNPAFNLWQNNDYVSQYYSQYYQNYYRQWLQQHNRHSSSVSTNSTTATTQLRQPLKYGSRRCHSRAIFSQNNNNLLIIDNTSQNSKPVLTYSLSDLFVDYLFPNQLFHLILRSDENQLPFDDRESCLQWIRCKQQLTTQTTPDFELKLILRIIQMILKQNSKITGLDLSELLFDLIDTEALNKSFSENDLNLNSFRILLMRGQKTVALNHALSSGLMDHALCLSYLMVLMSSERRRHSTTADELMLKTIRKFCDTLRPNDPISVYYNSVLNCVQKKQIFLELSFESFLILLSNEMNLNSIEIKTNSQNFKHLLDLIKSLQTTDDYQKNSEEFILSDDLFESEMDSILINECLEFSRFSGKKFNSKLIEKKLKFVSILFDFGFISNSLKYCQQLKTFPDLSSRARRLVNEIESRFDRQVSFEQLEEEYNEQNGQNRIEQNLWTTEDNQMIRHSNNQIISEETTPDDIQTTPEHMVANTVANEAIPETTQEITEPFDYYGQLSSPVATFEPPPAVPPNVPNGDIGFSFVSSASIPSMPFNSNDFFENEMKNETTDDDNRTVNRTTANNIPKVLQKTSSDMTSSEKSNNNNKSGFFGKIFNLKPRNQAILPDDSNMTLKYDPNLKQWIDTSQKNFGEQMANSSLPPPPIAPSGGQKFEFRSRRRYVDITQTE